VQPPYLHRNPGKRQCETCDDTEHFQAVTEEHDIDHVGALSSI